MERVFGAEQARKILGELVLRVSRDREPVVITRRSKEKAVLLDYEEYRKLQDLAAEAAANRVERSLEKIQADVRKNGLEQSVVQEAIREVRKG